MFPYSKEDLLCHTKHRFSFKLIFFEFTGRDDNCEDIIKCLIAKLKEKYKGTDTNKILLVLVNSYDIQNIR